MRLAEFISNRRELILSEWESFARSLEAALTKAALRDHADALLSAIVADMESLEDAAERSEKSKGHKEAGKLGAIGQLHAVLRIDTGFTLSQVVAEYRALRASVFRLWTDSGEDVAGALRFNEAVDEALTQAVDWYAAKSLLYRDQLIGLVSHDLRNPLGGILMAAAALSRSAKLDDKDARFVARIQSSAHRMTRIVDDLLDLTHARFGNEIPLARKTTDAGSVCHTVISELEGSYPRATITFESTGDLRGEWDGDRLAQVVSNLVGNALKHGDAEKPVHIAANGEADSVVLTVHNEGPPIPPDALKTIFEPNIRNVQDRERMATGLGLGLFIARILVTAHGGEINVASGPEGTVFTVRFPRLPKPREEEPRMNRIQAPR